MELAIAKTNVLKRDLKRRLQTIQTGVKTAIGAAWDAGEILTELKGRTDHGKWLPLLKQMGLGERMAQKYMKLHEGYEREAAIEQKTINDALEDKSKPKVKKEANGTFTTPKENTNSRADSTSNRCDKTEDAFEEDLFIQIALNKEDFKEIKEILKKIHSKVLLKGSVKIDSMDNELIGKLIHQFDGVVLWK